ncbi:hypothetical protein BJY01DRAFT_57213 [Aspergillus pseudoustus]|uniref:Uncharacterized protein n=1 Tax=Aspergillus pseudoustus TaxID=1810923 RepID=A0ABR4KNC8_9EURO
MPEKPYLVETNVGGLLTEALTADVHLNPPQKKLWSANLSHRPHGSFTYFKLQISEGRESVHIHRTCGSDQRGGSRHGYRFC